MSDIIDTRPRFGYDFNQPIGYVDGDSTTEMLIKGINKAADLIAELQIGLKAIPPKNWPINMDNI